MQRSTDSTTGAPRVRQYAAPTSPALVVTRTRAYSRVGILFAPSRIGVGSRRVTATASTASIVSMLTACDACAGGRALRGRPVKSSLDAIASAAWRRSIPRSSARPRTARRSSPRSRSAFAARSPHGRLPLPGRGARRSCRSRWSLRTSSVCSTSTGCTTPSGSASMASLPFQIPVRLPDGSRSVVLAVPRARIGRRRGCRARALRPAQEAGRDRAGARPATCSSAGSAGTGSTSRPRRCASGRRRPRRTHRAARARVVAQRQSEGAADGRGRLPA